MTIPPSMATVETTEKSGEGSELRLQYALASEPSARPFVALVNDRPTGLAPAPPTRPKTDAAARP